MYYIPFSEKELIPAGIINLFNDIQLPAFSTPISPKENYELALRGKKPLWIPMFSDCKKFMPLCVPDNIVRGTILGDEPFDKTGFTGGLDMFGIDWEYVPEVRGSTVRPGKPFIEEAEELITKVVWPDPAAWDWAGAAERNKEYLNTDQALNSTIFTGFFERLISFMDFENAAISIIDEDCQEYIHDFFDKLSDLYIKMINYMHEYFHLDTVELHDDWGSQRAPLLSISTIREMIIPYLKKVVDHVHSLGMIFELHSCGCNASLTPAMIEAGVDIWCPQPNANDTTQIFEDYGDKITIGTGCPLPPGSSDEEYIKWAEMFVEKYVGRTDKRTPFLFNLRTPDCFRETAYRLSRIKLCGQAQEDN